MLLKGFEKLDQRHAVQKPSEATEHHRDIAETIREEKGYGVHERDSRQERYHLEIKFSHILWADKEVGNFFRIKEAHPQCKGDLKLTRAKYIGEEKSCLRVEIEGEEVTITQERIAVKWIEKAQPIAQVNGLET